MKYIYTFLAAIALIFSPSISKAAVGSLQLVASFNPAAVESPENLLVDLQGNIFITMGLTGEIRKVAPDGTQSTFATLPLDGIPGVPCFEGDFFSALTGIDRDLLGNFYVGVRSCSPGKTGIWKISPDGSTQSLLAALPDGVLPNGLAVVGRSLYVAESFLGMVWKVSLTDGSAVIWNADPRLAPAPGSGLPGANGLRYFRGDIYVASSQPQLILAIPINWDGSAGTPRVHASTPFGCDDFSFDIQGNLYCGTDLFNALLKVHPDGTSEILFTAADGLDGPSSTAFGRFENRTTLYVLNAAFPFFSTAHTPSLMKVDVGVAGAILH